MTPSVESLRPRGDLRIVPCETCGTEGRIIRQAVYHSSAHEGAPDEVDHGECPSCESTGGEIVEVEPIDLGDLIELDRAERAGVEEECECGGPPCQTPPGHGCGRRPVSERTGS